MSRSIPSALAVLGLLVFVNVGLAQAPPTEPDPESDPAALAVVERLENAMGGRTAWEDTRYVAWTFFGRRTHVWDRRENIDRIAWTSPDGASWVAVVDLDDRSGMVSRDGEPLGEDEAVEALEQAHAMWVNDSYWLVMPWKLRDPGVIVDIDPLPAVLPGGREADVLVVTFRDGTGLTPRNKYRVQVARDTGLVEQWAFYAEAEDDEPRFRMPWTDWTKHGDILLSTGRGEGRSLAPAGTPRAVPEDLFTDPDPVDITELLEVGNDSADG